VDVNRGEIEAHYCKSPFVKEVCLLGGDAVVVPDMDAMRRRQIVNVGDLLRFEIEGLSHALPPPHRIQRYEIWFEPLPRTATQVNRSEVEQRVRVRREAASIETLSESDQAWFAEPEVAAVLPAIQSRMKHPAQVRPDWNLELDVGLDSMERVELLAELEQRFGVRISSSAAAAIYTVRHLVDTVRSAEAARPESAARAAQVDHSAGPWAAILRQSPNMNWLLRKRPFTAPLLWVMLRVVRALCLRMRVAGLDRLPASGPYIIGPNHQSYVDPFVLCGVLPYRVFRDLFFVGAVEYFETPFTRWVARTAKLVPVDPDSKLVPAMQAGAFGLTHGKILLLFPEGERSIDGTVKKFKKGAPVLAQQLGVPIVPVAVKGTYELWPRNRGINWRLLMPWQRQRVTIEFGEPVALPRHANYDDSATRLRSRVNEMWEALST
jgi:long-chain acyl-CoA synthetase